MLKQELISAKLYQGKTKHENGFWFFLTEATNKLKSMNLKLSLLIIVAALLCGIEPLYAQNTETEITVKFFELYKRDPVKAVDYAFSTNKWMERNKDGVDNLKNQLTNTLGLIGDYYGYELITEERVGDNLKYVSYLLRYDRQPLRFTFFCTDQMINGISKTLSSMIPLMMN